MSDTHLDSDADSILDASNSHSDEALVVSVAVRELCNQLRTNDPRVLRQNGVFDPSGYIRRSSEAECIAVFQALKENTSVKHIEVSTLFNRNNNTGKGALVVAEYVESSKTLQILDFGKRRYEYSHEAREMISLILRALSRNTSVTKLIISTDVVRFVSVAFQELLTCTQTLKKLEMTGLGYEAINEAQIATIASGFANNTTLRDIKFTCWREADLAPLLTALQRHPALERIHFNTIGDFVNGLPRRLPSLSGLEVLLRSQDSKVKELILEGVDTNTVGLHPVLQELGRNTTVTNLSIDESVLSRENILQIQSVLRHNTTLQSLTLTLTFNALGNAGLTEITPVLYRNTSIKTLDLSHNDLDDIESANVLRELLRRNKTITSLCISGNAFGRDVAAARSIFEGLRCNTALQKLDLSDCQLGDRGISVLANALAARNGGTLELNLQMNKITSVGVRALVDDNVEAAKTLAKLCLASNPIGIEGATVLNDALRRKTMPNLKLLDLNWCDIDDDGLVALVSTLGQNTSLQILSLEGSQFGERGFMALAESLPNIKGLQQVDLTTNASFESTLPLLLQGFRKNTSLVKVNILNAFSLHWGEWSQELKFLGQRNRFTPLLKASDPPDVSPQLGIWSRALAKVAAEHDVLFHILRNKPKLVGSAGSS
jgi:Ran GTPase-activating protein (RanGAP) involved in mRNA processing and transport